MADEKITVLARLKAKPGKEEQLREALVSLIEPTRRETGCINYDLHLGLEDKVLFMFYENWTSKEVWEAHLASNHLKSFLNRADELLAEPLDVTVWEMVN